MVLDTMEMLWMVLDMMEMPRDGAGHDGDAGDGAG